MFNLLIGIMDLHFSSDLSPPTRSAELLLKTLLHEPPGANAIDVEQPTGRRSKSHLNGSEC